MATNTIEVLRWAARESSENEIVGTLWASLLEAVDEPRSASAERVYRELRAYAGNTLANLFRDHPIPYSEVATDVASAMDGIFGSGGFAAGDVESCERFVLAKMEVDADSIRALCDAVAGRGIDPAVRAQTAKGATKAAAYGVGRAVATAAANQVAKRAARETSKRVAQQVAKQVAVRIAAALNVFLAAWTVVDLAGPALRVTIPGVTYVALLRKLLEAVELDRAAA